VARQMTGTGLPCVIGYALIRSVECGVRQTTVQNPPADMNLQGRKGYRKARSIRSVRQPSGPKPATTRKVRPRACPTCASEDVRRLTDGIAKRQWFKCMACRHTWTAPSNKT
jgi:ribosomal protein L37AE/L43A